MPLFYHILPFSTNILTNYFIKNHANKKSQSPGSSRASPHLSALLAFLTPPHLFSWAQIKQISESGIASAFFSVGEEKQITLSDGTVMTMQVADFNHDVDVNGDTIGMTFVSKELLPSKYNHAMNASGGDTDGWNGSEMRAYLNSDILALLPQELSHNITEAVKKATINTQSTEIVDSIDKLFLLSTVEINDVGGYSDNHAEEGTTYALFANWPNGSASDCEIRAKRYADTNEYKSYWLRSSYGSTSQNYFNNVGGGRSDGAGSVGGCAYPAGYQKYAICFAFCI